MPSDLSSGERLQFDWVRAGLFLSLRRHDWLVVITVDSYNILVVPRREPFVAVMDSFTVDCSTRIDYIAIAAMYGKIAYACIMIKVHALVTIIGGCMR